MSKKEKHTRYQEERRDIFTRLKANGYVKSRSQNSKAKNEKFSNENEQYQNRTTLFLLNKRIEYIA